MVKSLVIIGAIVIVLIAIAIELSKDNSNKPGGGRSDSSHGAPQKQ